jgi:7-cyano-7-deazaguanine synthase in queuosine biosynthesis
MKIAILYSGGLDSFILKKYMEETYPDAEIKCIYYAHGADSEIQEISQLPDYVEIKKIDWLTASCRPMAKRDDPFAGAIYIPGRNLVFCVLAASQELADEIVMGTVYDEDNPKGTDKNELFREGTSALLSYVLSPFIKKVKIRFPFVENRWTKRECVKWALKNNVTPEELTSTVSCWNHHGTPCGECKQCFKRYLVFKLNGFEESYLQHPLNSGYGLTLIDDYLDAYYHKNCNKDEREVVRNLFDAYNKNLLPAQVMKYLDPVDKYRGWDL